MSLLNKNKSFNVRDYLFAAVGLLSVFLFFLTYSKQDPRSTIQTELNQNTAANKAATVLDDLGYTLDEQDQPTVRFEANTNLLDSLQANFGRHEMIKMFSDTLYAGVYPYLWEVHVRNLGGASEELDNQDEDIRLRFDELGRLIEFINPNNVIPDQVLNKEALIAAFESDRNLQLWQSLPDSAWDRVLHFNPENNYNNSTADDTPDANDVETSHTFSRTDIENLANYYLQNGGWDIQELQLSNIEIETISSQTVAEVTFASSTPVMGQDITVDLQLLPTGALINLNADYNVVADEQVPGTLDLVRLVVMFLFTLAVIIVFYFRIRSRAVDTQSSLIVGIVAGLIIPAIIFLEQWISMPLFSGTPTSDLLGLALQMGVTGAFSSIGFFGLFAVGDSLMRQYWSEKLYYYDYLRQGMFFNKPIGEMILRSVVLAFILCGIWSTALFLFPDLYFEVERTFLTFEAAWSPLYLFLENAWFSLIATLIIFSIAGTQVYGLYKNKWYSAVVMVFGVVLMMSGLQNLGPALQEITFFGVMGVSLTVIFLKWDVLTTVLSYFFFMLMIESSSGWIVDNSHDFYIFLIFCLFLLFNIVAGILFITKGEEHKSLSGYVPEYVKELAQEERIKQELQIAREVQQSFLPVQTPDLEFLDLAAICKPAYETGGDYYDFIKLDDHRVAVTIGDVSGKGIQAAFYMTFIKGILHSLCREIDSPAEILKKTNRLFCENAPRGTFISLVYGIIDLEEKVFRFARAGHNPILRVNASQQVVEELQPRGIGIGLTDNYIFDENIEEVTLNVDKDDVIVLYTDGIVEALNSNHKFYGSQRLNNILLKNKKKSVANILEEISFDVRSYIADAEQHDDMTMLIMKWKDSSGQVNR